MYEEFIRPLLMVAGQTLKDIPVLAPLVSDFTPAAGRVHAKAAPPSSAAESASPVGPGRGWAGLDVGAPLLAGWQQLCGQPVPSLLQLGSRWFYHLLGTSSAPRSTPPTLITHTLPHTHAPTLRARRRTWMPSRLRPCRACTRRLRGPSSPRPARRRAPWSARSSRTPPERAPGELQGATGGRRGCSGRLLPGPPGVEHRNQGR